MVSIRAPREGGDRGEIAALAWVMVSIRAPREGGDPEKNPMKTNIPSFNPRPP